MSYLIVGMPNQVFESKSTSFIILVSYHRYIDGYLKYSICKLFYLPICKKNTKQIKRNLKAPLETKVDEEESKEAL